MLAMSIWAYFLTATLPVLADIHIVFTTECTPYFTWQSIGKGM